jgi:hypothetical protein
MSLKDKLKVQKGIEKDQNFDWQGLKVKFERQYELLINNIKETFKEYVEEDLAEIIDYRVDIEEKNNGEYQINSIKIHLNKQTIIFQPVGAEILGASGRFDFYPLGKKDLAKKVLLEKSKDKSEDAWIFWEPNGPYHRKSFNKNSLEDIIEDWM